MGGYKEHKIFDILKRKNVIFIYIFFILIIFSITTMFISKTSKEMKIPKDIEYTENSKLDYKIYLKENDFFDKGYLEKENQYIASLIDFIEADFRYELEASESNINYKYSYKIIAEVNVEDKTNHKSLYEFDDMLVESKQFEHNTNSKLIITEPVNVDYNKYNDIVKRFINLYDLDNSNATVTINMYVELMDEKNKKYTKNNTPVISLKVPLSTDTIAIDMESNEIFENTINISKKVNQRKNIFISISLIIINFILIIKLIIFLNDTKNEKAVYNMRLRKIMANYGSYIQKLNNEFCFENHQILEIKSFEDLLQIRETLSKPILMTEKTLAMETYFFISSEDNCYVYELKAGNLRKTKGKRFKE